MKSILRKYRHPLLLAALVLMVLLPGTALLPIVDRDEPRFATATREMIQRHDWIVPTFNGADRFDKPVLIYWLMRGTYALFGVNPFGARLPSILCTIALVVLVWHTGRRWFGSRAGILAGAGMATCLQIYIHGRLALADMPMVLAVTVIQILLADLFLARGADGPAVAARSRARAGAATEAHASAGSRDGLLLAFGLWAAVGLGFLAKGPVAVAVPLVAVGLFAASEAWLLRAHRRHAGAAIADKLAPPVPLRRDAMRRLRPVAGVVLALIIVGVWGIPALLETHGRFFSVGVGEHVVQRGFERFNGRGYNPFFYLLSTPVSLWPWTACAGFAAVAAWAGWRRRPVANPVEEATPAADASVETLRIDAPLDAARRRWLAAWFLAPVLIFTAYATQLPHYVLPGFPAFFLLLGAGFAPAGAPALPDAERPHRRTKAHWVALAVVALIVGAAVFLIGRRPVVPEARPMQEAVLSLLGVLMGLTVLASALLGAKRWLISRMAIAGALLFASGTHFASGVWSVHLSRQIATKLATDAVPEGAACFGVGFGEPSLVFYSGRHWTFVDDLAELTEKLATVPATQPVVIVHLARECDPAGFFLPPSTAAEAHLHWYDRPALPGIYDSATWQHAILTGLNLGRTRWQQVDLYVKPGAHP